MKIATSFKLANFSQKFKIRENLFTFPLHNAERFSFWRIFSQKCCFHIFGIFIKKLKILCENVEFTIFPLATLVKKLLNELYRYLYSSTEVCPDCCPDCKMHDEWLCEIDQGYWIQLETTY